MLLLNTPAIQEHRAEDRARGMKGSTYYFDFDIIIYDFKNVIK